MRFVECLPVEAVEAEVVGEVDTSIRACSDGPASVLEFEFVDIDCAWLVIIWRVSMRQDTYWGHQCR